MKKELLIQLSLSKNEEILKQLQRFAEEQFSTIAKTDSNDEIFLELDTLKVYCHKVPIVSFQIIDFILNMKQKDPVVQRFEGYGKLQGKSYVDLMRIVIDILERLQFSNLEKVFNITLKLTINKEDKIRNKALELLRKISAYYKYFVVRNYYKQQIKLVKYIADMKSTESIKYFEGITTVLLELLSPEFEGTESKDENTIIISDGSLPANKDVKFIRKSVIELLVNLYTVVKEDFKKTKIISILSSVSQVSLRGMSDEFENLLVENIEQVFDFYISIIPKSDFVIIKVIEDKLPWIKRRFGNEVKNFKELSDQIKGIEGYEDFSILVGRDIFDDEYQRMSWPDAEEKISEEINNLIEKLSKEDFEKCKDLVNSILNAFETSQELNQDSSFRTFLKKVGEKKPNMGMQLLNSNLNKNEIYLSELLNGLWRGNKKEIKKQMISWIDTGEHLVACTFAFDRPNKIDIEMVTKILGKADGKAEILDKLSIVIEQSFNKNSKEKEQVKDLYIQVIKEMTKIKSSYWTRVIIYNDDSILNAFNKEDWKVVNENLVFTPSIEYHTEEVLKALIKEYPEMFIKLFKDRLQYEASNTNNKSKEVYEAIPFEFENMRNEIKEHKDLIVPEFLKWLNNKDISHLGIIQILNDIFPLEELDNFIINEEGKIKLTARSASSLLYGYQGHINLNSKFVQAYIKKYSDNDKKLESLMSIMSVAGGVVMGEYGFANDMKRKLKDLDSLKFKNKEINSFIEKYKKVLEKRIEKEIKDTKEEIVIRRERFRNNLD